LILAAISGAGSLGRGHVDRAIGDACYCDLLSDSLIATAVLIIPLTLAN